MPKKSISQGVLKAIRSMIRAVEIQSKMLEQKYGLTGPQLLILKELEQNPIITTSQIANNITISQSTATIIIDRLVEKELVDRIRDTVDKRKWFITLTAKGKNLVINAPSLLQDNFIYEFERLPEWKQNETLTVLQHVVAMLNTKLQDESAPIITIGKELA